MVDTPPRPPGRQRPKKKREKDERKKRKNKIKEDPMPSISSSAAFVAAITLLSALPVSSR